MVPLSRDVFSPVPLPSGTVLQTEVTEEFELSSGDVQVPEGRRRDVVVYRPDPQAGLSGDPAEPALHADFPVVPSRGFEATELLSGRVHVDVLAGREGVRGTVGGNAATTVEDGAGTLNVASGALPEDTVIELREVALSGFLPASAGTVPLGEFEVDFSGGTLGIPAELSMQTAGVDPSETLVVARVVRVLGVPRLAVVALAEVEGDRVVTVAYPGLPGVTEGGRYVFYRVPPIGFVAGETSTSAGGLKAVVQTAGLAFIGLSRGDGSYIAGARGQRGRGGLRPRHLALRSGHRHGGRRCYHSTQPGAAGLGHVGGRHPGGRRRGRLDGRADRDRGLGRPRSRDR